MDFFVKDSFIYIINIIRQAITFNKDENDIIKGNVIEEVLKGGLTRGYLNIIYYKFKFINYFFFKFLRIIKIEY